jgi:DNA-binding CsgD family transcriptional regulator
VRVSHDFDPGFRVDHDDYSSRDIARDPYYQDYLRPIGLFWHANARLKMEGSDELAVSFKRELKHGTYDAADQRMLDHILPHLRASARLTECVFDAETRGMVRALHQRGRPVLEFDAWGRVRRQHGIFDGALGPLTVIGGRAITAEKRAQIDLEQAIAKAATPPRRQTPVLLHDAAGRRYVFQIIPVIGRARDVFLASSAIGMLVGRPPRNSVIFDQELAIALFGLTIREAHVVGQLCEGRSIVEIAARLGVVPETVRFHLKSIFEKTGARRQAELVGLLGQLIH